MHTSSRSPDGPGDVTEPRDINITVFYEREGEVHSLSERFPSIPRLVFEMTVGLVGSMFDHWKVKRDPFPNEAAAGVYFRLLRGFVDLQGAASDITPVDVLAGMATEGTRFYGAELTVGGKVVFAQAVGLGDEEGDQPANAAALVGLALLGLPDATAAQGARLVVKSLDEGSEDGAWGEVELAPGTTDVRVLRVGAKTFEAVSPFTQAPEAPL